jgi:glucose-6-phosphate isomerase
MPYTRRLELFGDWYRQLWAESLGKKVNTNGDIVHVGPSPLAALGPMDQHSQLQLYIEGPNNKTITFIKVATFTSKLRASVSLKALKKLSFLANTSFAEILHAELEGTAEALRRAHRPNGILTIPTISCESIGSLFMFFQLATGVAGSLYNIHTYDQPGVEEGKKLTAMLLSKN